MKKSISKKAPKIKCASQKKATASKTRGSEIPNLLKDLPFHIKFY